VLYFHDKHIISVHTFKLIISFSTRDIRVRMIQRHKSHLMFPKYQALCDLIKISSNVLLNSVTQALLKPDDLLLSTSSKSHSFVN